MKERAQSSKWENQIKAFTLSLQAEKSGDSARIWGIGSLSQLKVGVVCHRFDLCGCKTKHRVFKRITRCFFFFFLIVWVEHVMCAVWGEVSGTLRWPEGGAIGHRLADSCYCCQILSILLHIVSLWLLRSLLSRTLYTQKTAPSTGNRSFWALRPSCEVTVLLLTIFLLWTPETGEDGHRNPRKYKPKLWARYGFLDNSQLCSPDNPPNRSAHFTLYTKWESQLHQHIGSLWCWF